MSKKYNIIFATILHLLVDFVCIMIIWSHLDIFERDILKIIYTVLAFGTQSIIGIYLDISINKWIGVIGAILVGLAGIIHINTLINIIIAGLGNSMFHVGASLLVINDSKGKLTDLGIFVSSGAIGVGFGKIVSNQIFSILLIILSIAWGLYIYKQDKLIKTINKWEIAIKEKSMIFVVIVALLGVVIRSAGSGVISTYTITGYTGIMVISFSSCIGKALGGILGDKFGAKNIGCISMILSIIFYGSSMVTGSVAVILGIISFNMAMPITLGVIIDKLEGYECFGFGLTTLGLLIGTIIPIMHLSDSILSMMILSICACICIAITTQNKKVYKEKVNV